MDRIRWRITYEWQCECTAIIDVTGTENVAAYLAAKPLLEEHNGGPVIRVNVLRLHN